MEVAVDIRDDLQVKVLANHFSLVQVFMNLIINALDAMNEGPRAINVEISEHEGQAKLVFYDKGQGIPLEILESVSQPFFTTKEHKGTGLGLAICREIIEIEHGGRFLIGNHPQWGAQFTICLPILVDDAREVQDG
jgi:C4-dicarboxylate-specific signal transduction histidine kinase